MGAPVPALLDASPGELAFAHVDGEHCQATDLPAVAALLGSLHAVAFVRQLHEARLEEPFSAPDGTCLAPFARPRLDWLDRSRWVAELTPALVEAMFLRPVLRRLWGTGEPAGVRWTSWSGRAGVEDGVCADPAPDHVWLARDALLAVLPGGAPVGGPRHLIDSGGPLHAFDP